MANGNGFNAFEYIALYADGSSCQDAAVGAWAFKAPEMNLEGAGTVGGILRISAPFFRKS